MAVSKQEQNIRRARGQVRHAVQIIRETPENLERIHSESSLALRELTALRDELADDAAFADVLRRVGFDAPGSAEKIVAGLNDVQGFQKSALVQLAQVPVQDITTARLMVALRRHIESPKCRQDMVRRLIVDEPVTDPAQEFTPFLNWLFSSNIYPKVKAEGLARLVAYVRSGHAAQDMTDPNPDEPTVVELKALLARMREGKQVSPQEADGVLGRRFSQLFVPMSVSRLDLEKGLKPMALPTLASAFSLLGDGSVEGGGCVDALIRDAKNPHHWHLAAATSAEDTFSQNDQLARHHQGVRNRMDLGQPPFGPHDDISSLSFVSPSLLLINRKKKLEGTGPAFTAAEEAAINSLNLLAQIGHPANINEVRMESVLRYEHFVPGGSSAAQGGFGLSGSQLVVQSAAHWGRAVQALAHEKRDITIESATGSATQLLMNLTCRAGEGFLTHFAADAEKSLRQAVPALQVLSERIEKQGHLGLADQLANLADRITNIGPRLRERRTSDSVEVQPSDVATVRAHEFQHLERHQQFEWLTTQNAWSPDMARRWSAASAKAAPSVWNALLDGTLVVQSLDAHRAGLREGQSVLSLSRAAQGQWLRHFVKDSTPLVDRLGSADAALRHLGREPSAQDLRATVNLSVKELSHLVHIQHAAAPAVWNAVISQSLPIQEVVEAMGQQGKALLDLSEQQQTRWVAQRFGSVTGVRKRLLEAEPVSAQHADFLTRVRPALVEGVLSDPTLDAFDRVARQGSARLYGAVMLGAVSALRVTQSSQHDEPVLDLPKSAQNDWLRQEMDHRVTEARAPAARVIQEAQARQVTARRRSHTR